MNIKKLGLMIAVLGIAFLWNPVSEMLAHRKEARQNCDFAKRILGNNAVNMDACQLNRDLRHQLVDTAHDVISEWRFQQHEKKKDILSPSRDRNKFERITFYQIPQAPTITINKKEPERFVVEGLIGYDAPLNENQKPNVAIYPLFIDSHMTFQARYFSASALTPLQLEFIEDICLGWLSTRNGLCEGDIFVEWIERRGLLEIAIVGADLRPGDREAYEAAEQRFREARATRRFRE